MSGMRILVSFKVTPDFEMLREADWAATARDGVDTRYVRRVLNCFDESALELALRLAGELAGQGAVAELAALSVAGRESEPFFKTLLALGYERATRVPVAPGLDFAPAVTATIVARFARRIDRSDLVLLGCRSGPGDSGTIPFMVAEALGWPCLSQVVEVSPLADGRLRVACTVEGGLLRATLRLPCVLAVGNAVVSHLRVPALSDRLARRDREIAVLPAEDLGVDIAGEASRASCVLTELEPLDLARPGVVVAGEGPGEKARMLFAVHLKARIAKLQGETGRP